jgi:hypothetical protein
MLSEYEAFDVTTSSGSSGLVAKRPDLRVGERSATAASSEPSRGDDARRATSLRADRWYCSAPISSSGARWTGRADSASCGDTPVELGLWRFGSV